MIAPCRFKRIFAFGFRLTVLEHLLHAEGRFARDDGEGMGQPSSQITIELAPTCYQPVEQGRAYGAYAHIFHIPTVSSLTISSAILSRVANLIE